MCVSFIHYEVISFAFQYWNLFKEVTVCTLHLIGELCSTFWGWSIYKIYLEICMGNLSLCCHLFKSIFISVWTHGYFILQVIIQYCFILLLKLLHLYPLSVFLADSQGLLVHSIFFFFFLFLALLTFWHYKFLQDYLAYFLAHFF